jgi:hypothetical protein
MGSHWALSNAGWMQFKLHHPISLEYILIPTHQLYIRIASIPSYAPSKVLYGILYSPIRAT